MSTIDAEAGSPGRRGSPVGRSEGRSPRKESSRPVRALTPREDDIGLRKDAIGPVRAHTPSPPIITPVAPPFSTPGYPYGLFPGGRPDGLLQPAPLIPSTSAGLPHGGAFLFGREKGFAPMPSGARSGSHFDAFHRYGLFERCLCPSLGQTPSDWLLKHSDSVRQNGCHYYYGLLEKDHFMNGLKPGGSSYNGGMLSGPVPSISPYRPALPSFFLGKDGFSAVSAPYPFRYPTLVDDALRKPAGALIDESPTSSSIQLTLKTSSNKTRKGHLCIYCGKLYSRKYGLKIHLRTHTGYKPLKCKVCLRPFGDPSNLNKHIRLHAEGETPYRCPHCGKVLVRRRDLERHVKSRHPDAAAERSEHGTTKPEDDAEGPRLGTTTLTATSDGTSDADAISDHDDDSEH
ncbi:uncharacterized protein LOC144885914 [Branchiostoma floridae x Branchiostoma japonicum]